MITKIMIKVFRVKTKLNRNHHMKLSYNISIIFSFCVALVFTQERTKDTIDSQTVNVIKPYTPTISDAFKIKDKPSLNDANTLQKKEVKYNIFSIPVASIFTPAKGKAANVDKAKPVKLYDNYATLGFGSFTTILGEVYLNHELNSGENVGAYFSHHSSQGGIDGLLLDNDFSETALNVNYSKKNRDFSWKIDLGADLQAFNWYGLPQNFFGPTEANTIDSQIQYNSFYVGGKLDFDDSFIDYGNVKFRRFGDDRNSGENRFTTDIRFNIPLQDEVLETELRIDYLGGSFDRNYTTTTGIDYGNISVAISPSYQIKKDDLTVNLGARLVYFNDIELSDNKLFIYPNVEASYRLVSDIVIGYAGVTGDLIQNSFYDVTRENPFMSPTLFITPTDQQYRGFIGVKGKLSNTVSYNIKGNYLAEDSKALFKTNEAQSFATEDYQFGNSLNVVYDNVKTFSVAGELNIDVNRNFKLGIKGQYFNYNTKFETEAWNLPTVTGSIFLDYQISEKWFAGGSAFFVGERKDEQQLLNGSLPLQSQIITLDSFFDANAHVGYNVTDFLSVYAKANNIANQNYERWLNFPVQGIQFLAGATYQFDF